MVRLPNSDLRERENLVRTPKAKSLCRKLLSQKSREGLGILKNYVCLAFCYWRKRFSLNKQIRRQLTSFGVVGLRLSATSIGLQIPQGYVEKSITLRFRRVRAQRGHEEVK